jgi:hypothetical protein
MAELINLRHVRPKSCEGPRRHMDSTFGSPYCDSTRDSGLCSVGYEGGHYWTFVRPLAA